MTSEPTIPELLAATITRAAPLTIDDFYYNDPTVHFSGPGWSLGIMTQWRLLRNNSLVIDQFYQMDSGNEDDVELIETKIQNLVGTSIIGTRPSAKNPNDPIFFLTDNYIIEIEADTNLDPWVVHLSGEIFVGVMA